MGMTKRESNPKNAVTTSIARRVVIAVRQAMTAKQAEAYSTSQRNARRNGKRAGL